MKPKSVHEKAIHLFARNTQPELLMYSAQGQNQLQKPPVSCKSSLLDDFLTRFLDDGPINPAATATPLTIAAQIASDVPA